MFYPCKNESRKLEVCRREYFRIRIPASSRTFQGQNQFPGLSRSWKFYKKIQDFPGGMGTLASAPPIGLQTNSTDSRWIFTFLLLSGFLVLIILLIFSLEVARRTVQLSVFSAHVKHLCIQSSYMHRLLTQTTTRKHS